MVCFRLIFTKYRWLTLHFEYRTLSDTKLQNAQRHDPQQQQQLASNSANDLPRQAFGIGIDMSSGTAEEAADRALSSVSRKLDKSLSVEYTVNQLIAEATDPFNLASIFVGEFGVLYDALA